MPTAASSCRVMLWEPASHSTHAMLCAGLSWKDRVAAAQQKKQPAAAAASSSLMSVTALTQQLAKQDAESRVMAYVQDPSRPKIHMSLGKKPSL